MPCGCKKGAGMSLHGAGYKKRKRPRRKKRKGRRGGGFIQATFNPLGSALSGVVGLARRVRRSTRRSGGGGRFLSGATWHGYGKGGGMSISGAGLYKKRVVARRGTGRRQI